MLGRFVSGWGGLNEVYFVGSVEKFDEVIKWKANCLAHGAIRAKITNI